MKFESLNAVAERRCETEIKNVGIDAANLFIQSWVPYYLIKQLKDPDFSYALFQWDRIIKSSLVVGCKYQCYGALTEGYLDGLLCLDRNKTIYILFIATAPWNYKEMGKMRRIGKGLIYFTIRTSRFSGCNGEFKLHALPDAEKFYRKIGMKETGKTNHEGLNEFYMDSDQANLFERNFDKYLINTEEEEA